MTPEKFAINEHVGIILYAHDEYNCQGRIDSYNEETGLYRVTNTNMPYMGSVNAWFSPYELEKLV